MATMITGKNATLQIAVEPTVGAMSMAPITTAVESAITAKV